MVFIWHFMVHVQKHGKTRVFCTKWCQDGTQKLNIDKRFHIFGPGSVFK